ncbi:hypothetical protein [Dinghuibacter silviterrae]|uniref:Uncharacterized protein n=1 Tax=Dinghuibacter silviterrae TaxID=1539049 RepID=A0A4R8DXL9_9BACT|nr:hypothetical protein [Dinghuibacter silviterrae]TDX02177.1 hypothetical protein EDB95_3228 [Dinghuibacter silviterrae]
MALYDFFRISLPYGMRKNKEGKWMPFNREYMPLAYNDTSYKEATFHDQYYQDKPLFTKYSGLTDKAILSRIPESAVRRGKDGKINEFWLYNDATNPMIAPEYWDSYLGKIKWLSKFKSGKSSE